MTGLGDELEGENLTTKWGDWATNHKDMLGPLDLRWPTEELGELEPLLLGVLLAPIRKGTPRDSAVEALGLTPSHSLSGEALQPTGARVARGKR